MTVLLGSIVGGVVRGGAESAPDLNPARPDTHVAVAGLEFHVPFGGMGDSSSGSRERGKVARDFFTQWKTVYLDAEPPA